MMRKEEAWKKENDKPGSTTPGHFSEESQQIGQCCDLCFDF